ncbi:protein C, Serine peptidase, MEROPS family S49 [Magnetococcus marinus MC-1]|uniref:Protein C, Serine peptidase, MEROPS family S49 n=1 Tax=Magnetococcus marinus (strain ATCC BAA-1437 / JCM 17883 / MC-1) TaxID=156889 RepID=A0LB95_MAGMM|nr:S49 family peptidase [Magnetococcus marinus]ABK45238.1 protein C, Serine peptidase, MEROPS family S49 [Magnetococcus marinus MC-1]
MTQNMLPHLASRILGTPLMVDRARLETILSVIGPRVGLEPTAMPSGFEPKDHSSDLMVTPNGIAIVPIHGTLVKRVGAVEAASGLMSYASIEEKLLDAATDPAVRAILMDIDSPGGEVGGVFDLAAMIQEAGQGKPIWALADDAFSAAYLIASQAHRIIVPQTAGVGSIGVIAAHVDESEKDAKEGRSYTTVFAGAHKNDFSSHAPLSDAARFNLQQEVDRLYGMFTGMVASGRNISETAVRATEAGLFFGDNAVKAGLADHVGTIRDALAGLTTLIESPKRTFMHKLEATMPTDDTPVLDLPMATTTPPKPPSNVVDLDQVRAEHGKQMRSEAQAIVDLCALAGMPHLAGGYIAEGTAAEAVRKELLAKRADAEEIHSEVMPGDGTRMQPRQSLETNPVVASCRKLAGQ